MNAISIRRKRVDEEVVSAKLDHDQISELLAQAVAAEAGVSIGGVGVAITRCWVSTTSSMSSGTRAEAEIEIRIDQRATDETE
ncbi:hypothetical protein U875_09600 [Pandoraea pnomenusa 3kgm]|nr:hypothetical protein U875_09600 [Pandoraea pnomenusa 3kgm]